MPFRRSRFALLIFALMLAGSSRAVGEEWSHVEWGGANYANPKLVDVDNAIATIEALIRRHGPKARGIFYLNDAFEGPTMAAVTRLKQECVRRGWRNVEIRPLVGDYLTVVPPRTTSAHMKNPEKEILAKPERLKALARASETGLVLDTFYPFSQAPGVEVTEMGAGTQWKLGTRPSMVPRSRRYLVGEACPVGFANVE